MGDIFDFLIICSVARSDEHTFLIRVKVKVNIHSIQYLFMRASSQKHLDMAHIVEGSYSFTCTYTHLSTNGMNHTRLCLPSWSWSSFTHPGGMEGWVGLSKQFVWLYAISIDCVCDRYNKCMSCYKLLMNVRSKLEERSSLPSDLAPHLREIRLLMNQLD